MFFKLTMKDVWWVYYDPPQSKLLNSISLTNGLKIKLEEIINMHMKTQQYSLVNDIDIIWLESHKKQINYDSKTCI
jgi:hypothetical protein